MPPPPNTKLASRTFLAFAVLGGGGFIALTAYQVGEEEKANWVVFAGDMALHAKIDGEDVGALGKKIGDEHDALAVELKPGTHTVEIVDKAGKVVESGKISNVPADHYRCLWATGPAQGWAVVQVGYGEKPKGPELQKLKPSEPHVYVLPSEPVLLKGDLEWTNMKFPKVITTKGTRTMKRICSLREDEEPTCM